MYGKGLSNVAQTGGRQGENELLTGGVAHMKSKIESFILNFRALQGRGNSVGPNVLAEPSLTFSGVLVMGTIVYVENVALFLIIRKSLSQ